MFQLGSICLSKVPNVVLKTPAPIKIMSLDLGVLIRFPPFKIKYIHSIIIYYPQNSSSHLMTSFKKISKLTKCTPKNPLLK